MPLLQAINSDLSVLIVCIKTGGTIKGDIKKNIYIYIYNLTSIINFPVRAQNTSATVIDIFIDISQFEGYTIIPI